MTVKQWRRSRFAALSALGLWLGAAGCARNTEALVREPGPPGSDNVTVDVVNDNFYDARVYAVYAGGGRHPMGTVPGNQRQEGLVIPWQPRPLAFEVHLIVGFGSYLSHRIDVDRGDYIELRLPPNFSTSGSFRRLAR